MEQTIAGQFEELQCWTGRIESRSKYAGVGSSDRRRRLLIEGISFVHNVASQNQGEMNAQAAYDDATCAERPLELSAVSRSGSRTIVQKLSLFGCEHEYESAFNDKETGHGLTLQNQSARRP